jgi:hypothetical protein
MQDILYCGKAGLLKLYVNIINKNRHQRKSNDKTDVSKGKMLGNYNCTIVSQGSEPTNSYVFSMKVSSYN